MQKITSTKVMLTIYRKYRPQKFTDISEQEHIVTTLQNEVNNNKIAHAYLFTGPRGVGKTTIARLLAKAVNCENKKTGEAEPCGDCSSCKEISNSNNIDVIEIDAASNTGVENVRENIIENAQFKPTKSPYKIFIIDEVHMLSSSAFNALLKTIEEPPAHVIFILATTELHKLPATVISRCQRFAFKKIPYAAILKRLETICDKEEIKVDKEVLEKIIAKSDGCLRDAESLLGQVFSLNLKKITAVDAALILPNTNINEVINFAEFLLNKQTKEAVELINNLVNDGINLEEFSGDWANLARQILVSQAGFEDKSKLYGDTAQKKIKELAQKFTSNQLIKLIDKTLERINQIKQSPLPQLPLELLVAEFCSNDFNEAPPTVAAIAKIDVKSEPAVKPEIKKESAGLKETIKTVVETFTHKEPPRCDLKQVQNSWNEMMEKIGARYPSLVFILKMCEINKVDENGLHVGLVYSLHKEKLEDKKTKREIENCLAQILGEKINIVCELKETAKPPVADSDLQNLANEFGGEIVS